MRELDRHVELELLRRICLIDRRAVDDPERLGELQKLRLAVQCRKSGLDESGEERRGASVENRWLRTVHVDRQVVDPDSGDRGEYVLDGMHRVLRGSELRVAVAAAHFVDVCPDSRRSLTVSAAENDALP